MNLHDLITLMILPIGTSGTNEIQYIKYTSEYILMLQIHQHPVVPQDLLQSLPLKQSIILPLPFVLYVLKHSVLE